ncbi:MAG: PHP domain-containing protein [Bacteroidota bacterium]|nr:MAG: PHP domain-containing protein [Bacteroidota bacterium]
MKWYRADLHVHSVLSPCGDLDMSPTRIIREAKQKKLDIIGISDHNTSLHAELMVELGKKEGIVVFPGVEISTLEEVHCLAFFETIEATKTFQKFLDEHSAQIANNPSRFGEQFVVNEKEEIIGEVEDLLIMGLTASIEEVERKVHSLKGVFIPAHIDRKITSIFSQIGFIPPGLQIDALEFSAATSRETVLNQRPELETYSLITNSDSHYPDQLGRAFTEYYLQEPSFNEWKMALNNIEGRKIRTK